jgi:hypothetical protein
MTMPLEQELATFQAALARLLQDPANQGKFALVVGAQVDSLWPSLDAALEAGYQRFGLTPFLVKEVATTETPRSFSRNLTRCP